MFDSDQELSGLQPLSFQDAGRDRSRRSCRPSHGWLAISLRPVGAPASEGTVPEGIAAEGGDPSGAAFAHTATDANSRGDYTYLGDPRADGDLDAVFLAEPAPTGPEGAAYAPNNIGAWYEPERQG